MAERTFLCILVAIWITTQTHRACSPDLGTGEGLSSANASNYFCLVSLMSLISGVQCLIQWGAEAVVSHD